MGLFSHRVEKSEIVAGDHIYTWRAAFTYSHHGIYLGGNTVVHFTPEQNSGSSWGSSLSSSAPGSKVLATCPTYLDCGFRKPKSGVRFSCLDCFLGDGSLYRFEYGVTPSIFLAKLRGGTCTTAKSDPPETVIQRAMHLFLNGFGKYDVFKNNCEDFALYCKTGLLILDQTALGRSGQASCVFGGPWAALLSAPLKLFMSSPVGLVTATAVLYSMSRYATDVGVRTDVIKVPVEDIDVFHGQKGPKELAEDSESCEGQVAIIPTDISASKSMDDLALQSPNLKLKAFNLVIEGERTRRLELETQKEIKKIEIEKEQADWERIMMEKNPSDAPTPLMKEWIEVQQNAIMSRIRQGTDYM